MPARKKTPVVDPAVGYLGAVRGPGTERAKRIAANQANQGDAETNNASPGDVHPRRQRTLPDGTVIVEERVGRSKTWTVVT